MAKRSLKSSSNSSSKKRTDARTDKRAEKHTISISDEVSLFPGYAHLDAESARWRIEVNGAIFDPEDVTLRKRMLLRILRRIMKLEKERLETPLFRQRIRTFVASTEKGKRVSIRIGDQVFPLRKKTKRNGHFAGRFYVDQQILEALSEEGHLVDEQLAFDVVMPGGDTRSFRGRIHILEATGVSVVSDIDDTIKFTDVTTRRELVENTFFREFRSIDSIADVYRNWAAGGADFHYVSSSPWQLLGPLDELFGELELPRGTMHLRNFLLRDQMLKRVMMFRRPGKSAAIRKLMKAFPQRTFVLVGDSRERDPEIYAKLCRQFPNQVQAIFIREWEDRPMSPERMEKIDEFCGASICQNFRTAEELEKLGEEIFLRAAVS